MARSQSQPYRAGWEVRPPRLALNTTAVTTAVTAATEPSSAERTGTARTPDPGSNAVRVPTTAAAGSPAGGRAQGPQHRGIRRGPADHLGQALSHQHEHGQRRDRGEQAQRDRLRPDRLLDLVMDDVGAVDGERGRGHVAVHGLPYLPLQILA